MIKRCETCEGHGCGICKGEGVYYDFNEDKKFPQYNYEKDEKWQEQMKSVVEATLKLAKERSKKTTK